MFRLGLGGFHRTATCAAALPCTFCQGLGTDNGISWEWIIFVYMWYYTHILYTYMYNHTHTHTYIYTCIHNYIYIYIFIKTYMYIYIYDYVYTYILTYLPYLTLHYITLHDITLHYTTLHYIHTHTNIYIYILYPFLPICPTQWISGPPRLVDFRRTSGRRSLTCWAKVEAQQIWSFATWHGPTPGSWLVGIGASIQYSIVCLVCAWVPAIHGPITGERPKH